ncbi:MAG: lipid II:glycine glycyltransferase FemX [Bacteroidales bacterium]|jgi:hypothetical protein
MINLISNIEKINIVEWESLISDSTTYSFFQTKACYDFYKSLSFLEVFIFGVSEKNVLKGVIVGYIQKEKNKIKHFFTRRAIIPGGVLLAEDISEDALEKLLLYCKNELLKKAIYIECRNYTDFSKYKYVFIKSGFNYIPHFDYHIDVNCDSNTALQRIGGNRRRYIRVGLRNGVKQIHNPSLEDIRKLYALLLDLYKTKVKTPLFPWEFFKKLYDSNIGIFIIVENNETIIGGSVCIGFNNEILYELFACGLDLKFKKMYPSSITKWFGIEYAISNGYKIFDLMGAGKPNEPYGVRAFKCEFGGELVEHGRFLCVLHPLLFKIGNLGVYILKKL